MSRTSTDSKSAARASSTARAPTVSVFAVLVFVLAGVVTRAIVPHVHAVCRVGARQRVGSGWQDGGMPADDDRADAPEARPDARDCVGRALGGPRRGPARGRLRAWGRPRRQLVGAGCTPGQHRHRYGGGLHRAPGPPGQPCRGCRAERPLPADRAARLQRRRRRRGGDLAGRDAVLPGADRAGARPGRDVPGPDDAAVRDRGTTDRAVPRPVQPRATLGDRRDDGVARLPLLGAGRCGRRPDSAALFPAALGCLVASKAYGVTRAAAVPRLLPRPAQPGQGQLAHLARRRGRRRDLGAAGDRRVDLRLAVVAALRLRGLRRRHHPGDPAAHPRRPLGGRPRARLATAPPAGRSRAPWCSPCGATPVCDCCRGS